MRNIISKLTRLQQLGPSSHQRVQPFERCASLSFVASKPAPAPDVPAQTNARMLADSLGGRTTLRAHA